MERKSLFLFLVPFILTIQYSLANADITFENIGPSGGRILELIADPFNKDKAYTLTDKGTLYKTNNSGATWTKVVLNDASSGTITSIALDRSRQDTIYVGVGSSLLFSTNGGASWTKRGSVFYDFLELDSDPSAAGHLYAIYSDDCYNPTPAKVFRSTNEGQSWTPVFNPEDYDGEEIWSLKGRSLFLDPNGVIYLITSDNQANAAYVRKSTNSGSTWTKVYDGTVHDNTIRSFALDPTNTQNLFAGCMFSIYRSSNQGSSWSKVSDLEGSAMAVSSTGVVYAGQGGSGLPRSRQIHRSLDGGETWDSTVIDILPTVISVSPINPSSIYVGSHYYSGGVLQSVDGGGNWSYRESGINEATVLSFALTSNAVYAAVDGMGVQKKLNDSTNWEEVNNGLELCYFFVTTLAAHPLAPDNVYAGTGDGIFRTVNGGKSWISIAEGLPAGGSFKNIVIDPSQPQIIYTARENYSPASIAVYRSTNGGDNWQEITNGLPTDDYIVDFAIGQAGQIYILLEINGVYRSPNQGASWEEINTGLPDFRIKQLSATSSYCYGSAYIGSFENCEVYRINHQKTTWSPTGLSGIDINAITSSSTEPYDVYASSSNYMMFRKDDSSSGWTYLTTFGYFGSDVFCTEMRINSGFLYFSGNNISILRANVSSSQMPSTLNIQGMIFQDGSRLTFETSDYICAEENPENPPTPEPVVFDSGSDVTLKSKQIILKSGVHAKEGSRLHIVPQ